MKKSDQNIDINQNSEPINTRASIIKWIKKAGFVGFLFFLIKGLLWLIIPYLIANHIINK